MFRFNTKIIFIDRCAYRTVWRYFELLCFEFYSHLSWSRLKQTIQESRILLKLYFSFIYWNKKHLNCNWGHNFFGYIE